MRTSARLFRPTENGFLPLFRMALGAVMLLRLIWYLVSGDVDYLANTQVFFDSPGWGWLPEIDGAAFRPLLMVMVPLAAMLMVGMFYRLAVAVLLVGWTYFTFIDLGTYGNLDYLLCWFLLIALFLPADRRLSWRARASGVGYRTAPTWTLWVLRFQLGVVYFFAGVIKIDPSWLSGRVVEYFITVENNNVVLAPIFSLPGFSQFIALGGLLFDLFIVPLLLWKRTRWPAFAVMVFFHTFNYFFIGLGTIPPVMITLTLIIFMPTYVTERYCKLIEGLLGFESPTLDSAAESGPIATLALAAFVAVHLALPMRHHLYRGDGKWNQHGQVYSWWLRTVHTKVNAKFYAEWDGSDGQEPVDPLDYIRIEQKAMAIDPMMIVEFAHVVAAKLTEQGKSNVRVYGDVTKAIDLGPTYLFLPRDRDLSKIPLNADPADYVLSRSKDTHARD